MKLQFKEQKFQVDAVRAVVDCFKGQALKRPNVVFDKVIYSGSKQTIWLKNELY